METTILTLPNELLLLVMNKLDSVADLAAVTLTARRLSTVANPVLYEVAARDDQSAGRALFHSVEHAFVASVRRLLSHGVDPRITAISSVPLNPLCPEFARSWPAATLFYSRRPDVSAPHRPGYFNTLSRDDSDDDSDSSGDSRPASALRHRLSREWEYFQWTALHIAAACGHDALVALLLDAGADVDRMLRCWDRLSMKDAVECVAPYVYNSPTFPLTPLGVAISAMQHSAADLLLRRGVTVSVTDDGITALHVAAWHGDLELCRSLVARAPHLVHEPARAGFTPFHYAAASGHVETIGRFLRDQGADIRATLRDKPDTPPRYGASEQRCDSLTQALRRRQYSTASALLHLDPGFAAAGEGGMACPLEACLEAPEMTNADKSQIVPIFQRLFRARGQLDKKKLSRLLAKASTLHLPQVVGLLLEGATDPVLSNRVVDAALSNAFCHVRSNDAIETVMALVDYRTTVLGRPSPGLASVFTGGRHVDRLPYYETPTDYNLEFTKPGALEAVLELARRIHDRRLATPGGVDPKELRIALPSACQPGGLQACEWLCSLGALSRIDEHGFLDMLSGTALPPKAGGNDRELAEWVVAQADKMGHKDWVLANCDVPHMIFRSSGCGAAIVAVRAGARLTSPRSGEGRTRVPNHAWSRSRARSRSNWPCQQLSRRSDGRLHSIDARHVLHTICTQPGSDGAEELLRLVVDVTLAGRNPRRVINRALLLAYWRGRILTPASFVCSTAASGVIHGAGESTRLALLNILLAAGAEVHANVEYTRQEMEAELEDIKKHRQPVSLWSALALEYQPWNGAGNTSPAEPAILHWRDDAVRSAIRSGMPTLVRAMLEVRPLVDKNTSNALLYLRTACGGDVDGLPEARMVRLSPQVLDVVLTMANLTHPDVPVGSDNETALRLLLLFFARKDSGRDEIHHGIGPCRCDPSMLESDALHLSQMVAILLARGAKWTARSAEKEHTALHALRALFKSRWHDNSAYSAYKQHNIEELRKYIVLDIHSDASDNFPDFNPFQMGDIKATTGTTD